MNEQERMEEHLRRTLLEVQEWGKGTLNALLNTEFYSCSYEKCSMVLRSVPEGWMLNPFSGLHGGMSATYIDFAMGVLCRCVSGKLSPTIQMNTSFLHAIPAGEPILIHARIVKPGGHICFTEGYITTEKEPDRPLVTGSGSYAVPEHYDEEALKKAYLAASGIAVP